MKQASKYQPNWIMATLAVFASSVHLIY